ncbi:MAG: glycoside hydrolase family 3 C-terminal domain-containing protein [Acidimicrobiia bacterium]|nr:glycoside hydrolase family 3 C-terminal domain-containing protein [Acidimicrobiia bacterium]
MSTPPEHCSDSDADTWASEVEAQLTDDERFSLISSLMVIVFGGEREPRVPPDVPQIAGYVPGVARLGVPALLITDAGLGVTNPGGGRPGDTATALPAGLALGATFNPSLARQGGALIGREARSKGFNVLCGGGMNLPRDPRHGRNFEYLSEDPLLSGVLAAEMVIGTQSEGVVSMVKHFALNSHETNKFWLDAVIDPVAHRESDLLAFQIAVERAEPGAVMGAYNKVNGEYCCGNAPLLNDVLKGAFGFRGWVMSDWMAVHDWTYALYGLDQHSGAQLDQQEWFDGPLRQALADGELSRERLSDMVRRILRSMRAVGIDRWGEPPEVDLVAHDAAALEVARQGMVLLENDGVLPLAADVGSIAVIGRHADRGVLAGGGSSQGIPPGGIAVKVPMGGEGMLSAVRTEAWFPSSPLTELRSLLPDATISFDPGMYPADAAELARRSDVAVVIVSKLESEGYDSPDLSLPFGQDALIEAVAEANPDTVVVLETGNPTDMPWRDRVRAILQAWYPGQAGGRAIAEVLTGAVNPSGRLPVTFPESTSQLPRPELAGFGEPFGTPLTIEHREGAEVGYRWFAATDATPRYPFGYGLGYTTFAHADLEVSGGDTVTATVSVTNTGDRSGADVVQLYLTDAAGTRRSRLLGFERVELDPGETRRVTIVADPRLLAAFDGAAAQWHIAGGAYEVAIGTDAATPVLVAQVDLAERHFGR